jgi:pyrimidine deaminase RibD-like protein
MYNIVMNISSIFKLAKNVAKLSTHKRCKLGAVIVVNGTPVAVGTNRGKTDPNAPFTGLRAEVVALGNAEKINLKGAILFVYREKKDGSLGLSKPYKYCEEALRLKGIKRVFYTIDEKKGFPYFNVEEYN